MRNTTPTILVAILFELDRHAFCFIGQHHTAVHHDGWRVVVENNNQKWWTVLHDMQIVCDSFLDNCWVRQPCRFLVTLVREISSLFLSLVAAARQIKYWLVARLSQTLAGTTINHCVIIGTGRTLSDRKIAAILASMSNCLRLVLFIWNCTENRDRICL